jgi:tellurite resistance protein
MKTMITRSAAHARRSPPQRRSPRTQQPKRRLTVDEALIALLIGAMDANEHVSANEAARTHNIIWSMKQFRRKSGDSVGRLIADARRRIETQGATPVITAAARAIPRRLRLPVLAVCADLLLVDGKLEANERRFLAQLGKDLAVDTSLLGTILDVMRIKNSA